MEAGQRKEGPGLDAADRASTANLNFLIITGLSGAGKTEALRFFEDAGYFCIDNLPPALIPKVAELHRQSGGGTRGVAVVVDIRGGTFFDDALQSIEALEEAGIPCHVLFLEADEATLVRRYKESRRQHPLAPEGRVVEGIAAERARLEALRGRAHRVIDTSALSRHALRETLRRLYAAAGDPEPALSVTLLSFGFKHGLPLDADLVFDARCLPNPHYVSSLRARTGLEGAVSAYVLQWPLARQYLDRLGEYLEFVLPLYAAEGRRHLTVAVGCTGGRHRSVVVVEELARRLSRSAFRVRVQHRDVAQADSDAAAASDAEDMAE